MQMKNPKQSHELKSEPKYTRRQLPNGQDVSLMKEFFGLSCRYEDMSPVLIPAGYTRDYIDGKITAGDQLKDVHTAFEVSTAFGKQVSDRSIVYFLFSTYVWSTHASIFHLVVICLLRKGETC